MKRHPLAAVNLPIVAKETGVPRQYHGEWLSDVERYLKTIDPLITSISEVAPGVNNPVNPALPASGVTVTNTYDFMVQVIIIGGNVTSVTINGVTASTKPVSSLTVILNPGDTIAFTYTSSPDWFWKALGV
jgi:hypothetical protein